MDIIVCVYYKTTKSFEFSDAKNPLLLVQNKEYKEIKGDNHSINGQRREGKAFTFTSYATKIDAPTTLYLYTDGFQDQFGGKNNKKFMKKRWKEQLNELSTFPIDQQKEQLEKFLANWMGAYPQLDDILVMGIELS